MSYDLDLDFNNICRICLMQQEKFVSLFTTQIVDGYIRAMPEMLLYCLDIAIDKHDPLPKKICETCKTTVTGYYTFKERCKRTEKVLLETFHRTSKTLKDSVDETEVQNENLSTSPTSLVELNEQIILADSQHVKNEQLSDSIKVELALEDDTHLDDVTDLTSQLEDTAGVLDEAAVVEDAPNVTNDARKIIELTVDIPKSTDCKPEYVFDYNSDGNDIEEIMDEDNDDVDEEEEHEMLSITTADDDSAGYVCELCQIEIPKNAFVKHSLDYHFLCRTCIITYETEEELNEHNLVQHNLQANIPSIKTRKQNANAVVCILCNKRWNTPEQLDQHMRLHEALNLSLDNKFDCHECPQCHTVYLKLEDLENHMSLHGGDVKGLQAEDDVFCTDYQFLDDEKPAYQFTCSFCKASYSRLDQMRCHLIIHFDSFLCPFDACGCEYDTFSRLSLHYVKKHICVEMRMCTHCNEGGFATFDDLQLHIRNECTAKKFPCDHCGKKFFSKKALQLHLKHAGEKQHKCELCSKAFAQRGELNIHMRSHTRERPFKCTICEKTYRTASMRAAHMDAHIDGKTYQCTVCSKMLQSRTSYRNHMKRHTMGRSYKCNECLKGFYSKYHLDLHRLKIHNKDKSS